LNGKKSYNQIVALITTRSNAEGRCKKGMVANTGLLAYISLFLVHA